MTHHMFTLALAAVVVVLTGSVSRANLIAWYELDEAAGPTVNATDGPNGFYESFAGGDFASAGSPGDTSAPVNSVLFDTAGQRINLGSSGGVLSGLANATASMWVKFADTTGDDTLLSIGAFTSGQPLIFWRDEDTSSGGKDALVVLVGSVRTNGATNSLNTTDWTHVAFTFEGGATVASGLRTYVNGIDVSAVSSGGNLPAAIGFSGTNPLTAGQVSSAISIDKQFAGLMDEIAIYDQVLTPGQIAAIAGGAAPTSVVPEPASAVLLGGLMLAGLTRRRAA